MIFFSFFKMFHSFASRWPLVKLLHGLPCSFSARVLQISNAVHPVTLGKSPAVPTTLLCPVLITWTPRRGYGYSYAPLLSTHYSFSLSVSQSLSCSLSTVSCLDLAGEFAPLDHLETRFFFFFFY